MKPHLVRSTRVAAAAVVAGAIGVVGAQGLGAHAKRPGASLDAGANQLRGSARVAASLSASQLSTIALEAAANSGERNPTDIQAVRTTHRAALSVTQPGALYPSFGATETNVVLITMNGRFTAYRAHNFPGAPWPTGTVISVVVDASTGRELDAQMNSTRPALGTVGTVIRLTAR